MELWGHVELGAHRRRVGPHLARIEHLGEPKVPELDDDLPDGNVSIDDHHVLEFEIAVQDASPMQVNERLCNTG